MTIDWEEIDWIRPTNNEIIEMSEGRPLAGWPRSVYTYEHMNWAAKESGVNRFYNQYCYPTGEDITMITLLCKKIVKEEGLVWEEPPKKRSWWNR